MCSIYGIYSHVGCDDDAELLHRLLLAGSWLRSEYDLSVTTVHDLLTRTTT